MKNLILAFMLAAAVTNADTEDRRADYEEAQRLARSLQTRQNTYTDPVQKALFSAQQLAAGTNADTNQRNSQTAISAAERRSATTLTRRANDLSTATAASSGGSGGGDAGSAITDLIAQQKDEVSRINEQTSDLQKQIADAAIAQSTQSAQTALALQAVKQVQLSAALKAGLKGPGALTSSSTKAAADEPTADEKAASAQKAEIAKMKRDPLAYIMSADAKPSKLTSGGASSDGAGHSNLASSFGHGNTLKGGGVPVMGTTTGTSNEVIDLRQPASASTAVTQ